MSSIKVIVFYALTCEFASVRPTEPLSANGPVVPRAVFMLPRFSGGACR